MSHAHRGDQAGAGSSRETYPRKETLHDEGVNESFGSSPPLPTPSLSTAQDGPAGSLTVRLAGAGLAEVEHERLLDGALEAEVELLQGLAGGEAGLLDPRLTAVSVSRCDLGGKERLGEALVAPLLGAGALGQLRQRPRRRRRLQRPE